MSKNKLHISIPEPCHENWQNMSLAEKGRFCDRCQKNVFDFTSSTDKEIINIFNQNQNLCGRFLNSQLNRDLIKPQKKSSLWLTTTSALISFIGLGSQDAIAQGEIKTEQTDRNVIIGKTLPVQKEFEISGIVTDETGPLPGANISVKGKNISTQSDFDGKYKIKVNVGDVLVSSYVGYESNETTVTNNKNLEIKLKLTEALLGEVVYIKKRSFFGRVFHSFGNLFR
ncbi:MAG TPA: carboxypeptidase-like regulatory domain-containing protein [Flavobacterium lutivivi]|nr:carboxypeptidase-like regulatory domain-containing protein [Flavobacterium lutivivi]